MKRQQQKEPVYTLPKPQKPTPTRSLRVVQTPQQQAIAAEFKRMDGELKRSYEVAKQGRLLADWVVNGVHINDDIAAALLVVRNRSRELYQNNPHVQNYFQLLETHVVGPDGYTLKVRTREKVGNTFQPRARINALVERHWKRFGARGVFDVTGRHSLKSLLALMVTTVARDGEAIVVRHTFKPTKKNPYGIAYQLIATDRLDLTHNVGENDQGVSICMGVEIDRFQKPIAYHFNDAQANQSLQRRQSRRVRVPADQVIHIYAQEHAEQVRGVPWLNAVMLPLHQLKQFEDSTMVAARIGASKTGFFYNENGESGGAEALASGVDEAGNLVMDAEPGLLQALPPGWKFQAFTPDFPAATFEAFVKAIKRSIANGVRIGYNTLFQDLSDVNYSSIRQDLIASRDMWKNLHAWVIEWFLEVIYEDWLQQSFLNNALKDADGWAVPNTVISELLQDYDFFGRSFPWVDPKNDMEALILAINMGIISRPRVAEMMGEDIYAQGEESAAFRDFIKRLDLNVEGVNDPEANQDREDVKEAAEAAAQATENAAKTAAEQAERQAATAAQAQALANASTADEVRALKRELDSVSSMLRDALERASQKPIQLMTADEIVQLAAEVKTEPEPEAPTQPVEEQPAAIEQPAEMPQEAPESAPVEQAPTETLEEAVEALEAVLDAVEAQPGEEVANG